jgi:phosphatidate phosphatase APP1
MSWSRGSSGQNANGSTFGGLANRLGNAWYGEGREQGATRAKLKGYLSGIKESYQQNYAGTFRGVEDFDGGMAEAYPDANITRNGDEEMILFPSYSRNHIKENKKGKDDDPNDTEATDGGNNNGQNGQAIQQHWDRYEESDPIVDVDVRGWIYNPHKGAMNRKQRLALGIARQLAGLPNIQGASPSSVSPQGSRDSSPHPIRHRLEEHQNRKEQREVDMETENMLTKAQEEGKRADRGEYSEKYGKSDPDLPKRVEALRRMHSNASDDSVTMAEKRATWSLPSEMTQEEATLAHSNLMNRLRPFYANPLANAPVSAFFYNEKESRQRTIYTNAYGQFALRAALDFIPTHVRILASENLSATQEIKISEASGISVISDIDDTIKHTGMITGAREAFRNAFLRNLDDLVIDGVTDWYTSLAKKGVQFHYVSNSPWQLFPALSRFFSAVGLPPGSYHLKQYSGMLQGIFEPVAERKKSTLDRIARDFPERFFLLVGDSGEADLEVYTDFVRENPGRVLGVFIRDVTTPVKTSYFDSNLGTRHSNPASRSASPNRNQDPELKAAIEASLKEFEAEERRRKSLSPNSAAARRSPAPKYDSGDLISFSDSDSDPKPPVPARKPTKPAPPPPKKPDMLRGTSVAGTPQKKAPPPRPPPRRGSAASTPGVMMSPASDSSDIAPSLPPRRAATINQNLNSNDKQQPTFQKQPVAATRNAIATYPVAAAQYASTRVSSALGYGHNSGNEGQNEGATSRNPSITSPSGMQTESGGAANNGLTRSQANRIELWKRRWATASDVLKKEGVVLKSWRVGTDVLPDSLKLVEKAVKLNEKLRQGQAQDRRKEEENLIDL